MAIIITKKCFTIERTENVQICASILAKFENL